MADLSLTKLPWKAQLALFVGISLAAAGAFYYFVEMPQQDVIAGRERELATIMTRVEKARATARQLTEFRRDVDMLKARLNSLKPILPEEKDAAELLRRVNNLAQESGLAIRGFKPGQPQAQEMHVELPIALDLEGSYHNLGMFLDRVSKFPRIINISALDVRAKQKPEPTASIDISLTATTFVLLDPAAAPPPTKKGAPKAAPAKTE